MKAKILAEKALDIFLDVDGKSKEALSLPFGKEHEWSAEDRFAIQVPGVLRLDVESGSASVKDDVKRRKEIADSLSQALEKWSAASLDELQERATQKEIAMKQLAPVSPAELQAASEALAGEAQRLTALPSSEREKLLQQTADEIKTAESDWRDANSKYQVSFTQYEQLLKTNLKLELDTELKRLQESLAKPPLNVDAKFTVPDAVGEPWLKDAQKNLGQWQQLADFACKQAAELASKAKRPEGETVTPDKLEQLDKQVEEARQRHERLEATINHTLGGVEAQGDLHARLVEAEEAHAKAMSNEERANADAFAVKELWLAFDAAREKLQKDVVAPLENLVTDHFEALTGGFYKRVVFSGSLELSAVSTGTISDISLDAISFGTREQLALLTRLSLAELLSKDAEKQVVILDDNLVHTDSERMKFACELLRDKGKNVQIVVFTCHPERYAAIDGSRSLALV